ncbi:MAG: penicillin-binding protein activator [Deltaproteobacteria bacterium]|nr:penicillin-binding protein activator [Deltaproteobacteria bacterium]
MEPPRRSCARSQPRPRKRRVDRSVLLVALLASLSSAQAATREPAAAAAPGEAARFAPRSAPPAAGPEAAVGVLLPLSGRYRTFGESCLRGIRVALGALENRTPVVRTVILDSLGDPSQAASAYQKLAGDPGIVAVLGPMLGAEIDAVQTYAHGFGMPTLTFAQRAVGVGGPLFRFSLTKEDQAAVLARYAVVERGLRRWAIFYPDDGYGREIAGSFREAVEALGGRVVADVGYPPGKSDLQAEAKRLQSRIGVVENQPPPLDGVFLPESAERLAMVTSYLGFVDIRGVQLLGASGWDRPQGLLGAMPAVEGGVFVDGFFLYSFRPEVRAFVDAFRDAYHGDPGTLEAYGFDAAALVRDVIAAGSTSRPAVLEQLRRPSLRRGATGETVIAAGGRIEKGLFLLEVEEGTVREIDAAAPAISGEPAPPPRPAAAEDRPPRPEGGVRSTEDRLGE